MTSSAVRHRTAAAAAEPYGGVLSRALLREIGAERNVIARRVAAERWRVVGRATVAVHTRPLDRLALWWRAVWEVGCREAVLDGASALQAGGLTGFDVGAVEVSVPWEARVRPVRGVRIHRVCRNVEEVLQTGPPRIRTPLATVRAAHWASSDRQAALVLMLPVQQRLLAPAHLRAASTTDRVRGRRDLVRQLVCDIADGAHSLGELDFARLCRRHGLPEPDRQVVVKLPSGAAYLDVRWTSIGLVVEIDGSGHRWGLALAEDNLRQNRISLSGHAMVLRFDLVALRLRTEEVLDQVRDAHAILTARRSA